MIRIGLGVFFLKLLIAGCVFVSNHSDQHALRVVFNLPNQRPVLHEPVFMDLLIKNDFGQSIIVDLGHNRKSNLEFVVTKPDGSVVQLPRASEEGFGRIGKITLASGQSYTQRILLNEWYEFPEVGNYKVKAELVKPLTTESGTVVDSDRSEELELHVLPSNSKVLSRVCQNLTATATNASNITDALDASSALSYVKDPVAVPYLKEVLDKGSNPVKRHAAFGLGRIGNRDAIENLLAHLNAPDPDLSAAVRMVLREAKTRVDDPKLKSRIEAALRIEP